MMVMSSDSVSHRSSTPIAVAGKPNDYTELVSVCGVPLLAEIAHEELLQSQSSKPTAESKILIRISVSSVFTSDCTVSLKQVFEASVFLPELQGTAFSLLSPKASEAGVDLLALSTQLSQCVLQGSRRVSDCVVWVPFLCLHVPPCRCFPSGEYSWVMNHH